MDLRQLRYFKEIVDQGSVTKAAATLHIAQPPLSMLLKQLEQQFGLPLIRRYREKWEVTEAGHLLYQHAEKMLHDAEMIHVTMDYLKQGDRGLVRIGVSSSCLHLISDVTKQFTKRHPDVLLQFIKGDSAQLERMMYTNDLDIVIILSPKNLYGYEMIALPTSAFALAVPASWCDTFTMDKISTYPFIFLESMEGYTMAEEIKRFFATQRIDLHIIIESKDIQFVRSLVAQEVGISMLPVTKIFETEAICYIDVPQLNLQMNPVLLYKQAATLSPACQKFISYFV